MSQYSEGGSRSGSDDFSTLEDYYQATIPTRPSFLTYIPTTSDFPYLDMGRKMNDKVPNFVPRSYNVLETGNYRSIQDYSNMVKYKKE